MASNNNFDLNDEICYDYEGISDTEAKEILKSTKKGTSLIRESDNCNNFNGKDLYVSNEPHEVHIIQFRKINKNKKTCFYMVVDKNIEYFDSICKVLERLNEKCLNNDNSIKLVTPAFYHKTVEVINDYYNFVKGEIFNVATENSDKKTFFVTKSNKNGLIPKECVRRLTIPEFEKLVVSLKNEASERKDDISSDDRLSKHSTDSAISTESNEVYCKNSTGNTAIVIKDFYPSPYDKDRLRLKKGQTVYNYEKTSDGVFGDIWDGNVYRRGRVHYKRVETIYEDKDD